MSKATSSPTKGVIIAGNTPQVLTLAASLLLEQFQIKEWVIVSSAQALPNLRASLSSTNVLRDAVSVAWKGEDVDGHDAQTSPTRFAGHVTTALRTHQNETAIQMVLAGGTNWMIGIASQLSTQMLDVERGDGLWVVVTQREFEHHPHYAQPGDEAIIYTNQGPRTGPDVPAKLVPLPIFRPGQTQDSAIHLEIVDDGLAYGGVTIRLPPLLLAVYSWLLDQTKRRCQRPQLPDCRGCFACALPPKHLPQLAQEFFQFYRQNSTKPGYLREVAEIDFSQRFMEYVSKSNANIRKQTNTAIYGQLRIHHSEGGYLPNIDKSNLPSKP